MHDLNLEFWSEFEKKAGFVNIPRPTESLVLTESCFLSPYEERGFLINLKYFINAASSAAAQIPLSGGFHDWTRDSWDFTIDKYAASTIRLPSPYCEADSG